MNDKDLALIEEYVKGRMSDQEKTSFEERLQSDPDLSSALSDRQKMEDYLSQRTAAGFSLDDIREMNRQNFSNKREQPSVFPLKAVISIAASFLLIAALYFLYQTYNSPASPEELYQAYAEPIPLDLAARSGSTCVNDQSIMDLYAAGKYAEAFPLIQSCLADKPDHTILKMAQGFCLMEMEQTEAAQKTFEEILAGESLLKEEAAWNLALSYVKTGKLESAKNVLEEHLSLTMGVDRPAFKRNSREEKLIKDLQKILDRK